MRDEALADGLRALRPPPSDRSTAPRESEYGFVFESFPCAPSRNNDVPRPLTAGQISQRARRKREREEYFTRSLVHKQGGTPSPQPRNPFPGSLPRTSPEIPPLGLVPTPKCHRDFKFAYFRVGSPRIHSPPLGNDDSGLPVLSSSCPSQCPPSDLLPHFAVRPSARQIAQRARRRRERQQRERALATTTVRSRSVHLTIRPAPPTPPAPHPRSSPPEERLEE